MQEVHIGTRCAASSDRMDKRCEWQAYLYPQHLRWWGVIIPLFGRDHEILERAGIVPNVTWKNRKTFKQNYIGRIVFPYWMSA